MDYKSRFQLLKCSEFADKMILPFLNWSFSPAAAIKREHLHKQARKHVKIEKKINNLHHVIPTQLQFQPPVFR